LLQLRSPIYQDSLEVYTTKLITKSLTLVALFLFTVSLFMTPPAITITTEGSSPDANSVSYRQVGIPADYPTDFTRVEWDQQIVNEVRNNTWESSHYRFGPTINWHSRHENNSLIRWNETIALDEWVNFFIEVPKDAISTQPFGFMISGSYFNMSDIGPEGEMQQTGGMGQFFWMAFYDIPQRKWHFYSTQNATPMEEPPESLPANYTLETVFGPAVQPFAEMNVSANTFVNGTESYWGKVQVRFNTSTTNGFYLVSCGLLDEKLNTIAQSQFQDLLSGRIIGSTFDDLVYEAVGGYYDWTRVSDDGSPLFSATRGVDFNMTATINNGTIMDNATILFDLPDRIRTQNWVFGLYTVTSSRDGAWQYNVASSTYVWNSSKTVEWAEPKFGYHWEDGYSYLDVSREYTYYEGWGNTSHQEWTWGNLAIIYDFATNTFDHKLGFRYRNSTWVVHEHGAGWQNIEWIEYEPWPSDGSLPLTYILNETLSGVSWNDGSLVLNLRGHISDDMIPTGSASESSTGDSGSWPLHINEMLYDVNGMRFSPTAFLPISPPEERSEYEQLRSLSIETPVSVVTLTHSGEPFQPSWMFQTDIGETFTVRSWLQGADQYIDDIDGIGFFLRAHEDDWGFDNGTDWHQWSEIEVQVRVSPTGTIGYDVYNRTVRTQWGFGDHYEWVMVEILPGRWEPQWQLVTDWFWEELTWDFTKNAGLGGWTNEWISMNTIQTKMPVNYVFVNNLAMETLGNDLKISFDVTPTAQMPQMEWQWDYFYGNLTWVIDYESGWGEHIVLGWTEDTVYSYMNGTKLYMEEPKKAEVFQNKQTLDLYERQKLSFINVSGEIVPLKKYVFSNIDSTYEDLVLEKFNYETGENEFFIKFINNTERQVFEGSSAAIFNISLTGGSFFLAYGDYPQHTGYLDYHSMLAVNGTWIVEPWPFWDFYTSNFVEMVDISRVEHTMVTYANGSIPLYMVGWPEYIGPDHYVMYLNGTFEPVEFFWNPIWGYYLWNTTDASLYMFDWPWELMTGVYNSQTFFIPHYMTNPSVYITLGGNDYQLPAPGVPIWHPTELNWIADMGFAVEFAIVDGQKYIAKRLPIQEFEPTFGYFYDIWEINVTGTLYNVTDWSPFPESRFNYHTGPRSYDENLPWTSIANGSYWVSPVFHEDWTVAIGHRNNSTYEFVTDNWLDLSTGFYTGNYWDSKIDNWNSTLDYLYVTTMTGEEFFYNSTWRATFMNVTLANGTFFYSKMNHPQAEPIDPDVWEIDQYYMVDIYGNKLRWSGWMDFTTELIVIDNVTGDDPWIDGKFFFESAWVNVTQIPVETWEWEGSKWMNFTNTEDNVVPDFYWFLQSQINGTQYEIIELPRIPESYRYNFPSWTFNGSTGPLHAKGAPEMIYKAFRTEGYSKKLDYVPLPVSILRQQGALVVGSPEFGMWEHDIWTINPLTGALDLDGNLDTTFDQFYVKEQHTSSDYFNVTQEYLDVRILWEPNNSTWSDEFNLHSFTGMVTFNWTPNWSENYIWTKASTGAFLTAGELNAIRNLLFTPSGDPAPGYWDIAWMLNNFTLADLTAQANTKGWDWIEPSQEWSWLWWELDEQYSTEVSNGTHSDLMDIDLAYQYAGMFAWNDTNSDNFMDISTTGLSDSELTHYWMPIDVESVNFTTPGEAWGNFNATDMEYRAVNETIDFGVTFNNVTGEVYPFGLRSYFDWYEGQYTGSDFEDFDERPTECLTEEFSIDVHFTGMVNATGSNIAEVKFDITVGDWDMFTPGGTDVLEGRSLAVAFYSDLNIMTSGGMTANATYIDDDGQTVTNDQASASANFTMASGLSDVALMSLGGAPYTWSKNTSMPTTVDAQTVPVGAFSAIYVSGGGHSATTFSVTSTQFFTVIGFPQWDGWGVMVDPIFVGYISTGTTDSEAPQFGSVTHSPLDVVGVDNVHIEADVTDSGGSDIAEVKVYDIDLDENHTMTFNEGLGRYEVNIPRSMDGRYTFNYQIIAEDNAGNIGVSSANAFAFRDNIAPTIDSLNLVNGTDVSGEIATITVTASDTGGSGISTVTLTYSNTSGDFDVVMTLAVSEWTGVIPNHAPDTIVSYYVTVEDVDGNSFQSATQQFTFASGGAPDTLGPSVTLVAHNPTSPTSSDSVAVSSDILDISGVNSATLQYRVDSGFWVNVTMTNVGNTWSGIIPAQADGASVTYRIVAYDGIGNEAVSGENSYDVSDTVTTPTTTTSTGSTTPTVPGPGPLDESLILIYGGFGVLVLLVVVLAARRRK